MIKYEDLKKLLNESLDSVENPDMRRFFFPVFGIEYCLQWWANVGYLDIEPGKSPRPRPTLIFDDIVKSNTWPHHSAMDLKFKYKGHVVFVMPIKLFKKEVE